MKMNTKKHFVIILTDTVLTLLMAATDDLRLLLICPSDVFLLCLYVLCGATNKLSEDIKVFPGLSHDFSGNGILCHFLI